MKQEDHSFTVSKYNKAAFCSVIVRFLETEAFHKMDYGKGAWIKIEVLIMLFLDEGWSL